MGCLPSAEWYNIEVCAWREPQGGIHWRRWAGCRKIMKREVYMMNFGQALEQVKQGKGMRLPQWKEDVVIRAQFPDEHSKMTAPYLYVESRFGRVPWKETMIELFAENWEIVG